MDEPTTSGDIGTAMREGTLALGARSPTFITSPSIAKIVAAVALAQAEIVQPLKEADNPFFKSKYAPLDVVWKAARMALAKQGIVIFQSPTYEVIDLVVESKTKADGSIETMKTKKYGVVMLVTMMAHSSGEWIKGTHYALADNIGPQGAQAALTYARRAALSSMTMVTPQMEDDDAEGATSHPDRIPAASIDAYSKGLAAAAKQGSAELKTAWEALPAEAKVLMETLKEALKPVASKADKTKPAVHDDPAQPAPVPPPADASTGD